MSYQRLAHGPFLRVWAAFVLAQVGGSTGLVALLWLANARGGGAGAVGLLTAALTLPAVASGVYAGVVLDRIPKALAIAVDNLGRAIIYAVIAVLAAMPVFPLAAITVLVAVGSALSPLSSAGVFALVPDVLRPGQTLGAANAAINAVWQVATLVGPGIGGVLVARFGAPLPLGLQAVLYLAAFALMLRMPRQQSATTVRTAPLAGARLLMRTPALRAVVLLTLAYWLAYAPLEVALPGFVSQDLRLGAAAYGLLWMMNAIGALVGSVLAGLMHALPRLGYWLAANYLLWGVVVLGLAASGGFPAAAAAMAAGGLVYAPYPLWTNTYLQQSVGKDVLGRAFGAYVAVTGMGIPLGALIASAASPTLSPQSILAVSGVACFALTALALAVPSMRHLPTLSLGAMRDEPTEAGG